MAHLIDRIYACACACTLVKILSQQICDILLYQINIFTESRISEQFFKKLPVC